MEAPIEILNNIGSVNKYRVKEPISVSELLRKLNINNKIFVLLVDGKAATLEQIIDASSEITILPKIAGG